MRNPFRKTAPYELSCPEVRDLLGFCPQDGRVFGGAVPWDW